MKDLPYPAEVSSSPTAHEVLRAWIVDGGLHIAFDAAFEGPEVWGVFLVDVARHVARAYAERGIPEDEGLEAIYEMFQQEWHEATDLGETHDLKRQ